MIFLQPELLTEAHQVFVKVEVLGVLHFLLLVILQPCGDHLRLHSYPSERDVSCGPGPKLAPWATCGYPQFEHRISLLLLLNKACHLLFRWPPAVSFYYDSIAFTEKGSVREFTYVWTSRTKSLYNLQSRESNRFTRIHRNPLDPQVPGSPVIPRWSQFPLMISVMIARLWDLLYIRATCNQNHKLTLFVAQIWRLWSPAKMASRICPQLVEKRSRP